MNLLRLNQHFTGDLHVQCFLTLLLLEQGNPKKHIAALKKAVDSGCVGEPSLYNALSIAMQTLK